MTVEPQVKTRENGAGLRAEAAVNEPDPIIALVSES